MGLYCSFTPEDLGYPETVQTSFMGEEIIVEVDYSQALEVFCDTFLEIATDLVPVDTGFLQSTIDSGSDGYGAWAEASAEYAQYPEYGTWCQEEQPYFRPAVEAGLEVFVEEAGEAVNEADRILGDELDAMIEAFTAEAQGLDFFAGLAMSVIAYVVLFPILVNVYGIIDSLTGGNAGTQNTVANGGGIGLIDIIIT